MKRYGFTLFELLALIAILSILVIISLPNVLGMFRQAKEDSFKKEAQELYQIAQSEHMKSAMSSGVETCFDGSENHELTLDNKSLKYYVKFASDGKIIIFQVTNDSYNLNIEKDDIKITDIDGVNTGKLTINKCIEESN